MKVLLVPSDTKQAEEATRLLAARLEISGIPACIQPASMRTDLVCAIKDISLVVSVGGDGTFLHAAHIVQFAKIPILGFNYGTLGFLSGKCERDEVELIADALSGDLHIDKRSTLDAHIQDEGGAEYEVSALNDIVYSRATAGRIVDFSYSVNGVHMSSLRADGLIVATSTGSTGYALSVGGPIVSPEYRGMLVVPIAPHTLNSRTLLVSPSDVLEITTKDRSASPGALFVDGEKLDTSGSLNIKVFKGSHDVLIARGGGNFYENASRVFFKPKG